MSPLILLDSDRIQRFQGDQTGASIVAPVLLEFNYYSENGKLHSINRFDQIADDVTGVSPAISSTFSYDKYTDQLLSSIVHSSGQTTLVDYGDFGGDFGATHKVPLCKATFRQNRVISVQDIFSLSTRLSSAFLRQFEVVGCT